MSKLLKAAVMAAVLTSAASIADAATATAGFTVTATVQKTCSVTATNLAFPAYTPGGGQVTSTSTVGVKCTNGTGYTVALDKGTTAGATMGQRLMASGGNTLQYNLYTQNTDTTVWGDGTGGSSTQAGTGAGVAAAQNLTVYGLLPDSAANQASVPGAYSDTITVTVTY